MLSGSCLPDMSPAQPHLHRIPPGPYHCLLSPSKYGLGVAEICMSGSKDIANQGGWDFLGAFYMLSTKFWSFHIVCVDENNLKKNVFLRTRSSLFCSTFFLLQPQLSGESRTRKAPLSLPSLEEMESRSTGDG